MGSMSHGTTARIVVTGAAGMVGSHVAEQLLARGDAVVGVDNLLTGSPENLATLAEHPGFEFVEAGGQLRQFPRQLQQVGDHRVRGQQVSHR